MAGVSHHAGDLSSHPDVSEMRERYARMLSGPGAVAVDGLALLAGLFAAISPWTVHFSATQPALLMNNVILGLAVALIGIGLSLAPDRMGALSGAMAAIGVWLILSPWVVSRHPDTGMVLSNVIVGAVICLTGLAAAGMLLRTRRAA